MSTDLESHKQVLKDYYARKATDYSATYTGEGRYRSNYFRLETVKALVDRLQPRPARALEAGCGSAHVVEALLAAGYDCVGIDQSPEMIDMGRERLRELGHDPSRIRLGDIYKLDEADRSVDLVVCLGVLDILPKHDSIFQEFRRTLRPGGRVIFSAGNELFNLFSANAHTVNFYGSLFQSIGLPPETSDLVCDRLRDLLRVDQVTSRPKAMHRDEIGDDSSKIENYSPLNVRDVLARRGFEVEEVRFYHYHPLPPRFEVEFPDLFRSFAEKLETTAYDWRGAILCNCMIVQARLA